MKKGRKPWLSEFFLKSMCLALLGWNPAMTLAERAQCEDECPKFQFERETTVSLKYQIKRSSEGSGQNWGTVLVSTYWSKGNEQEIEPPEDESLLTDGLLGIYSQYSFSEVTSDFQDNFLAFQSTAYEYPEHFEFTSSDENSYTFLSLWDGSSRSESLIDGIYSLVETDGTFGGVWTYNATYSEKQFTFSYSFTGNTQYPPRTEELTLHYKAPVRYRLCFVAAPGKHINFNWIEQQTETGESGNYGENTDIGDEHDPTLNPLYSYGAPPYQNANNGTVTAQPDGTISIIGGSGSQVTRALAAMGDSSVLAPGYAGGFQRAGATASAKVKEVTRSFSAVGNGCVQHSPWYSAAGVKAEVRPKQTRPVCLSCKTGHDEVEDGELTIPLGLSSTGFSAGEIQINAERFLAAAGGETPPVGSASACADEECLLAGPAEEKPNQVGKAFFHDFGEMKAVSASWGKQLRGLTSVTDMHENSDGSLQISMYKPASMDTTTEVWEADEDPVAEWSVSKSTSGNAKTMTVTKTAPGEVSATYTFTIDTVTGATINTTPLIRTEKTYSSVNNVTVERKTVSDSVGIASYVVENTFEDVVGVGRLLKKTVEDPDGAALTTTREYYTDATAARGKLRFVVGPTGGWTHYDYDSMGRLWREITGRENSTLSDPVVVTGAMVTEYSYTPVSDEDTSEDTDTPRTITVKIGATPVSKSYAILHTNYTKNIQCVNPGAPIGDASNLTNTTWLCREGAVWTLGKVRKIDYADGQRESHFYQFPNADVVVETILVGEPDPQNSVNVLKGTRTIRAQLTTGKVLSLTVEDIDTGVKLSETLYSLFDTEHRPRRADYMDGTFATMEYDCCGLESVTHSDGRTVNYEYDDRKRLQFEHHTEGENTLTLIYTYDANDRLLGVDRKWNSESIVPASRARFDLAGRILSSTNLILGVTNHHNYQIVNGQEIITTTYPNGSTRIETYNRDGGLAKVAGTAVAPARYSWGTENVSGVDRIFSQRFAVNQNNSEPGYWVKSYLDAALRPVKITSSANNPVQVHYNAFGQLTNILNADGLSVLRSYDSLGRPEFNIVDLHGDGMFHLDGTNRVSKTESQVVVNDADAGETVYRVQSFVWPTANTDSSRLAGQVKMSLDGRRVWKTVYNSGTAVTSKSGIGFNSATKEYYHTNTAPNGTVTREVILFGLIRESKTVEADGTVLRNVTYGYDTHNRLNTVTDVRNGVTTINYNSKDQVESVVTPAPVAGGTPQTTTYQYNLIGQLYRTILPDGSTVTNDYHPNGLLAKRSGSQTYPTGYGYDDAGRLKTMTNWTSYPSQFEVTQWNYDPTTGRLQSMWYPNKTTGGIGTSGESYTYTHAGKPRTKVTARGITTTYDYNPAGELTTASFTDGTPQIVRHFNRLGLISQIDHSDQVISRDYNHAGQLLNEAHTSGPLTGVSVAHTYNDYLQPATLTVANGATTLTGMGYGYIPAGGSGSQARLQSVTGGPAGAIRFGYVGNSSLLEAVNYNTSGGSTWIGRSMQYDFLNRLKQIATQFGDSHTYEFDALNRRTKDTLADNSRWDYAYDELGQLTNAVKSDIGGAASLNNSFAYSSDKIGNLLTVQSPALGGGEPLSYSHNRQNQMTSVPHSPTTPMIGKVNAEANLSVLTSESFMSAAARQGEDYRVRLNTGITGSDRYLAFTNYGVINQAGGQPDIVTESVVNRFLPKNASETVVYDLDGNLQSDGRWDYTWDALNRLTKIESKSTAPYASKHQILYTYDAGGRRIAFTESTNSGTAWVLRESRKFVYNGWDLVAELDGTTGAPIRSYGWLGKSGGLLWVKDHASGEFHVPSFDGNGNVTHLIQYSDKEISAEYEYEPFGGVMRATGPMALANPIRFSSEYHDDVTGFVYYGYRYYSPQTRRWLSRDPIGFAGGPNLYGFVGNDPVNGRDWFGLDEQGCSLWQNLDWWNDPEIPPTGPITSEELQNFIADLANHKQRERLKAMSYAGASQYGIDDDSAGTSVATGLPELAGNIADNGYYFIELTGAGNVSRVFFNENLDRSTPGTGERLASAPGGALVAGKLVQVSGRALKRLLKSKSARNTAEILAKEAKAISAANKSSSKVDCPKPEWKTRRTPESGLKDHARRHSNLSPEEYLKRGQQNVEEGVPVKGGGTYPDATYHVRKVDDDAYSVTITDRNGDILSIDTPSDRGETIDWETLENWFGNHGVTVGQRAREKLK